ncbi:hypothetical protein DFJ73DRAFT_536955 [Zopfochytrium polystomum]|nr:hypothetical protein DFJ73DRAFT_536955 [Zopfochytrium polystomum]
MGTLWLGMLGSEADLKLRFGKSVRKITGAGHGERGMIASEFKRRCEAMGVTPPPDVCSKLQPNEGNGSSGPPEEINLSGTSINPKVISSLMTALETDSTISTLILADAFLGDDVNNTLRTLLLEWNCVGIWEVGVRALADALAANRRLETLDLRNCKVGPRGCQTLAVGIKHNTSLRHLDLRWNNAGLIGGRAFVDVLQWNMSILEVLLTGNEVPEEVMRSVTVLLQRNKDKQAVSALTASHSEQLSSTLQTLAKHHQDAVEKLQHKLHSSDSKHQSVAERLAVASRDLSAAQAASKAAEDRANAIERDFSVFKAEGNARISDLQKDLKSEREVGWTTSSEPRTY